MKDKNPKNTNISDKKINLEIDKTSIAEIEHLKSSIVNIRSALTELDLKITKTAIQKIEKLTLNFETLKETFSRIEGSQKTKEKPQKWDALKIETSFKNLRMELDKLNQKFEESNHREIITKDELKSKRQNILHKSENDNKNHTNIEKLASNSNFKKKIKT